jgi:hypothetical protein
VPQKASEDGGSLKQHAINHGISSEFIDNMMKDYFIYPEVSNSSSSIVLPSEDTINTVPEHVVRAPVNSIRINLDDNQMMENSLFEDDSTDIEANIQEAVNTVFKNDFQRSDSFHPFKSPEAAVLFCFVAGSNEQISRTRLTRLLFVISLLVRLTRGILTYHYVSFLLTS